MTPDRNHSESEAPAPVALELALEQSHEVKAKVEAAADDLAAANEAVKRRIAQGSTTLSAQQALTVGETVETKVQECADDLHEVTDTLARGIDDLKKIEVALSAARSALIETETALATAHVEKEKASLRALHDSTTGLPNRDLFDDRLSQAISMSERHDLTLAVMFLDLDRFKLVNDTHGHAAGDQVLKEVARRLLHHARDEDTVCRNGGDEFLYLMVNPQGMENITRKAASILKNLAVPIAIGDLQHATTASIGIAVYPGNGITGDELVGNADAAMYEAKKSRGGWALCSALAAGTN